MSVRTTTLLVTPVWTGFIGGALLGRPLDGLLVALGSYIVLFAGSQPAGRRLRIHLFAAAGLLACITLGMVVGRSLWSTLVAYVVVAVVMVLVTARWFDPGPPGPYFFVLMVGGGTLLTPLGGVVRVVALVAAGCALALAFGQVDSAVEDYPERPGEDSPS